MRNLLTSLRSLNYRLYAALILMGFLPLVYTTVRIHFLGAIPSDWGFNIASQLAWVNIIYEVVQEALILPMFFFLGQALSDPDELANRVRTGALLTAGIFTLLALLMIAFVEPLLVFMAQKEELLSATVGYIRLEAIALIFSTTVKFLTMVLVVLKREIRIYLLLLIQLLLSILLDTIFLSRLSFSLNLGVNGIALSNIVTSMFLLATVLQVLRGEGIRFLGGNLRFDFSWLKAWLRVGGLSGLESFVRNAAFILMVLRLVNIVQAQGVFWVANSFIWGWLLLPVLSLGELIKRDCGESALNIEKRAPGYFALTGIIVAVWLVSMPFWQGFIRVVMGVAEYQAVYRLVLISISFYVVFAFNNVVDSIFYGRGRTDLMLYQSLLVNGIFFGTAFILYRAGIYRPSLTGIAVLFGLGMTFDSLITFIMYHRFCKSLPTYAEPWRR